ncbi:MAG: Gfo/Idh/MocA family oxidoreductase, partial [bacterium]
NLTEAAKQIGHEIKVVALADFFLDKAQGTAKKCGCDEKMAFGGGAAYKKVMESGCEIVILATPPAFRPIHLAAAVKAGKHVFAEKPVAVDGLGIRQFLAAAAEAKAKKLALVAGTQRRHQGTYLRQAKAIKDGKIGSVIGGAVYWNGRVPWTRTRRPEDTNATYLANNWVNWTEMSGDHIVEQHVHNIDVANWFIGRYPKTATGFGARTRRKTGNQYDFFSVDFDYDDGVHIHSMCRQIAGCSDRVGELFRTADAEISGGGKVTRTDGKEVQFDDVGKGGDPYVNEHVDLLEGILSGNVLNEGENVAMSTACAIIGRISAYTGRTVRMSDILENKESEFYSMNCKPTAIDFESDKDVELPAENSAPIPGADK